MPAVGDGSKLFVVVSYPAKNKEFAGIPGNGRRSAPNLNIHA
jgi:hypothetical protein